MLYIIKMIIKVFNNEENKPQHYSFKESEVIVGRNPQSDCSVVINSHTISRNHLKVRLLEKKISLQDLGSSNGTFLNESQLDPKIWYPIANQDKIKLAEFEGYLQFEIRENSLSSGKETSIKATRKVSSSESDSQRSRSRQKPIQLPFKISESTFKMLKDMTINKKSKQQRIKFLRLMGISKASDYWQQIEKLLKQKRGIKDKQETIDNLERQFNMGRSGMEKRGLGR